MIDIILAAEPEIRLTAFLSVLAAMALWELAAPRRRRDIPRVIRWSNNLALVVIDTAILRLSFPILAVGLAVLAEEPLARAVICSSDNPRTKPRGANIFMFSSKKMRASSIAFSSVSAMWVL